MKKMGYSICFFLLALFPALVTLAATPTDINYCAKGKTMMGAKYTTYTVRCSNGQKQQITAWDNRTKWCVGNASTNDCSGDQLKAAQKACN